MFKDYVAFHSPAIKLSLRGRVSGGVVALVRRTLLDYVTQVKTPFDHMICLQISKTLFGSTKDIIFTLAYIPPYQSPYYKGKDWNCHIHKLEEFLLQAFGEKDVSHIILGDLNSRISDWTLQDNCHTDMFDDDGSKYGNRQSKDNVTNMFGRFLIDLCNIFHLVPLNGNAKGDDTGNFTFVGDQGTSVVDYILVSSDIYVKYDFCFHVHVDRVESKHVPIHMSIPHEMNNMNPIEHNRKETLKTFSHIKWDSAKAGEFVENINDESSLSAMEKAISMIDSCVETALDIFNKTMLGAAECMRRTVRLNTGQTRRTNKRWYDKECIEKKRAARRASRKCHKTDLPIDRDDYIKKRNDYSNTIRNKNKIYKQGVKDTLLNERKNGSKFWSLSKDVRCTYKPPAQVDINDWEKHFKTVLNTDKDVKENNEKINKSDFDEECVVIPQLDESITETEIRQAIKNLKVGKANGIDEISAEYLKCAENVIVPFLCKFYNKLFDFCYFPVEWSKSIIIPLFKRGDEQNPDNYRGISLLSIVSKVFTSILNKRLYVWAESEDKISPEQAGFRRSFSTVDHIFTLISIVQNRFNSPRGGKVYACFVDYSKAFDYVDRDKVWDKFKRLNTSTKFTSMLKCIYNIVLACVRWNGELSGFFSCPLGLKQGCLLSPIIFSLLIGDVADNVRNNGLHGFQMIPGGAEIFSLLFADDIVLLSSTPHGLQRQINSLQSASKTLGLTVNLNKTKVMVFRKGGFLGRREKWWYGNNVLEVVNSYKYLGFLLTTQLSYNIACDEFASKAKGKVLDIMKTVWCIGSLNTHIFFQFFDAQIKPMLLYASEIWGLSKVETIESAHLFGIKRLLSVSDKTPNTMVYGESGRYPLYINSTISAVRYWLKLLNMPDTRIPKQCLLQMTRALDRNGHVFMPFWVQNIRDCLIKFGFQDVWVNQGTTNEAAFLKELKRRMINEFVLDWKQRLQNSDRFLFYR